MPCLHDSRCTRKSPQCIALLWQRHLLVFWRTASASLLRIWNIPANDGDQNVDGHQDTSSASICASSWPNVIMWGPCAITTREETPQNQRHIDAFTEHNMENANYFASMIPILYLRHFQLDWTKEDDTKLYTNTGRIMTTRPESIKVDTVMTNGNHPRQYIFCKMWLAYWSYNDTIRCNPPKG